MLRLSRSILVELVVVLLSVCHSIGLSQPAQQQEQLPLQPQVPVRKTAVQLGQPEPQDQPWIPAANNVSSPLQAANKIKPLIQAALAVGPNALGPDLAESLPALTSQLVRPYVAESMAEPPSSASLPSYGNDDPLTYLDYASIGDEVLRKRTANFVYFNANFSHCRNCHMFFSIWKELAADIRWWGQVVKLFSINCSDEDNIDTCRRAGVLQFPQVRFYWVMSGSLEHDGQRLRILGKSVHALRHLIMDKVLDSYDEHQKMYSSSQRERVQQRQAGLAVRSESAPGGAGSLVASMMSPLVGQLLGGSGALNAMVATALPASKAGGGGPAPATMQAIGQLMSAVMGSGSSRRRLVGQPLPNNWPELEPIEAVDTQQLLNLLPLDPAKEVGALLVMETQEFLYSGLEVMLDLNPYSNHTYIARVRDDRSRLSKNLTKRDDILAPALIYVSAAREPKLIMTAPKYTNDEDLRCSFVRAFVRSFERRQPRYPVKRVCSLAVGGPASPPPAERAPSESQEDEELLARASRVYMDDLTNALRASLMEQVFRHSDLSDDQYNALVKYVYALINYFPFQSDDGLKFAKRLHTWLQNQVTPLDISEYKKQFHDVDEVLQQREWAACKSLSNTKAIHSKSKRTGLIFENPAQLGKMVSNLTRLLRSQQQQAVKLTSLFSELGPDSGPKPNASLSTPSPAQEPGAVKRDESPVERLLKSLTSGSLGSDSSILKFIASSLTGRQGDSSGASGRPKFAREYPCGAWKLAHVMVVNEYIKDSPRKDVKHIVLHSLNHYMQHFYACPTCGNRVSDVAGEFRLNLDEHLQEQADSVLLLWKMHNRVNKRLEAELRPGSPAKSQFPSETLCHKCRAPRAQNELAFTPSWHEKQVLNFLVHHYRPLNLIINTNSTDVVAPASSAVQVRQWSLLQWVCLLASSWPLLLLL